MPEIASRRHLELVVPVVREALDGAGRRSTTSTASPSRGAGPDRRAARRPLGGEGARLGAPAAARPGQPPARPRRVALPRARTPSSRRSSACSRAAGTRCCSTCAEHGVVRACSARRSTTRPARRSTRARACSGSAIRAARRSTGSRARAIPRRTRSPSRASPGSTSPSRGSRRRCSTRCATSSEAELERRRADLAASYQRAIVRALVGRTRAGGRADRRRADRGRRRRRGELGAPRRAARRRARAARRSAPTTRR